MSITIRFDNYNSGLEEGVRVYRSETPIEDAALPAPLATLPPGSTSYVDDTSVRGTKYYYRFGVFQGTDELISPNKAVLVVAPEETGPGPNTLLMGDWDLGYFGYCPSTDLTSYGGLATLLGITAGNAPTADFGWHKVAYKGKVLFIARGSARNSIAFNSLYLAGAVYGTNDNGPVVPTAQAATNQYRPQTINGYTFIPRILKGAPDGSALPALKPDANAVQAEPHEFEDIMSQFVNASRSTTDETYGSFGRNDMVHLPGVSTGSYTEHVQQQAGWDNTKIITRGQRLGDGVLVRIPTVFQPAPSTTSGGFANGGGTYTIYPVWRPVLELVI
jgi:hypothetical protein